MTSHSKTTKADLEKQIIELKEQNVRLMGVCEKSDQLERELTNISSKIEKKQKLLESIQAVTLAVLAAKGAQDGGIWNPTTQNYDTPDECEEIRLLRHIYSIANG